MVKVIFLIFAVIGMTYSNPVEPMDPCLTAMCSRGYICVKSFDESSYNCIKEDTYSNQSTRSINQYPFNTGSKIRHSVTNVPNNYYSKYHGANPCMSSPCGYHEICRNLPENKNGYICQGELEMYADVQQARSFQKRKMKQDIWKNLQNIFKKQQAQRKLTPLKAVRQKLRDSDYEVIPEETLQEKLGDICVDEAPGTKIINPLRISQYVICLNDEDYMIRNCPRGSVFNTYSEKCERTRDIPNNYLKGDNPCLNNSTFLMLDKYQYRCECPPGFTGKNCQKIDICQPEFCGENGVCLSIGYQKKVSHMCWCNNGVEIGMDCDDSATLEPNPCLNNIVSKKYHSLKLKPSVYIECGEENKPMLKTCLFPLIFSEGLQECDWM